MMIIAQWIVCLMTWSSFSIFYFNKFAVSYKGNFNRYLYGYRLSLKSCIMWLFNKVQDLKMTIILIWEYIFPTPSVTDICWYHRVAPLLPMSLCCFSAWAGMGNRVLTFTWSLLKKTCDSPSDWRSREKVPVWYSIKSNKIIWF